MGNSGSKKRKDWIATKQYSTDVEPTQRRSVSPFKRCKSAAPGDLCHEEVVDVPQKPGKAIVTLTNLQSDKPSGSCVTDSIYLDWTPPKTDGGRPVQGYNVEMYDLPTGNWVTVTQTEGRNCRSMLDNILCGIMYRFRVRAFNEVGSSVPGIPSDAFVIDTPGVHIAPYFIVCPPPEVSKFAHETVQFRAKALGTPTPNILWQKDDEPIFITQGIDIDNEPDGSLLTVHNLQLEDQGVIECVAVNHVGKATATTALNVNVPPNFHTNNIPKKFCFRHDDMIRLKFPIEAQPIPELNLIKNGQLLRDSHCQAFYRDRTVVIKVDSCQESDTGNYRVEAVNTFGTALLDFDLTVEVPPEAPTVPEILDVAPTGELTLAWQPPETCPIDHYIVEYYRDQWQLWLRMKTCLDSVTVIQDLIPGSKYKFRVMSASVSGISEPSPESEEIMIGKPAEDELFDLPRGRPFLKKTRKVPSFDRSSLDRSTSGSNVNGYPGRRHVSLDREVYYDANNVRRDVVTYKPTEPANQPLSARAGMPLLGQSFSHKLSNDELAKYRTSMTGLCNKIKAMSNQSIGSRGSKISLDTAMKPLQMEITNQARKSNSMGQLWTTPHIDANQADLLQHQTNSSSSACININNRSLDRTPSEPPPALTHRLEPTNDVADCKKSLSDIRDRIGSLQSLLKTSRTLTTSNQKFFSDLPTFNVPDLDQKTPLIDPPPTKITHRNNSYANAIDTDPVVEGVKALETHFPYNPDLVSLGSLECDKFPQETKNENNHTNEVNEEEMENSQLINQTISDFFRASISPGRKLDEPSSHAQLIEDQHLSDDRQQPNQSAGDEDEQTEDLRDGIDRVSGSFLSQQQDGSGVDSDAIGTNSVSSATMQSMHERSVSSCSDRTMLVSRSIEDYVLSDSTQTLQQRSLSSCSQGTLLAEDANSFNSEEEDT